MRDAPTTILTGIVTGLLLAATLNAQDQQELEKRLADRLSTIKSLKDAGTIGETWEGSLAAVKEASLDESVEFQKKKVTVRAFIDDENKDRKAIYGLIAARESTEKDQVTVEYVAERSAKDLFSRADPGHHLLQKNGKWIQKPRRR